MCYYAKIERGLMAKAKSTTNQAMRGVRRRILYLDGLIRQRGTHIPEARERADLRKALRSLEDRALMFRWLTECHPELIDEWSTFSGENQS